MLDGSKSSIISIHALLAESDQQLFCDTVRCRHFYPRSPCGERRAAAGEYRGRTQISIHALLAESDPSPRSSAWERPYFYPRSPCGERPVDCDEWACDGIFLSTLSLRRATDNLKRNIMQMAISIHALLAESDSSHWIMPRRVCLFLSTLSLRRATILERNHNPVNGISIHALLAESDR